MLASLFAAIVASASVLVVAAPAPTSPDPDTVYVQDISYGGSGCAQGSVGYSISKDKRVFTLIFDNYIASLGAGIPITESRKSCQLNINLHVPEGYSYSINQLTYRGFANIGPGNTGTQSATYYFSGQTEQASAKAVFNSNYVGNYEVTDEVDTVVWAPCGGKVPLNIKSAVEIEGSPNKDAQSLLTTDSIDGKFTTVYYLDWRGC